MAFEYYALSTANANSGTAKFGTAHEDAFRARTDVDWWIDYRGCQIEAAPNGRFTLEQSRVFKNDFQCPTFTSTSEALGPYWALDPTSGTKDECRHGINQASNTNISGFNNRLMVGNATAVFPSTDWTMAFLIRFLTPSSATIFFGTSDTTAPFALACNSTGFARAYPGYSSGLVATPSATALADQLYHLLTYRYDSVAKTIEISVDNVVVKAMAAFDASAHVGQTLQFGQITTGGSTLVGGTGFAIQTATCIKAKDGVSLALFNTVLGDR